MAIMKFIDEQIKEVSRAKKMLEYLKLICRRNRMLREYRYVVMGYLMCMTIFDGFLVIIGLLNNISMRQEIVMISGIYLFLVWMVCILAKGVKIRYLHECIKYKYFEL